MKRRTLAWSMLALAIAIGSALVGGRLRDGGFAGSDSRAMAAVAALQPAYRPWFGFVWEPPPEIAGGLFALQAALGAGVLGYYLGFKRGQARRRQDRADEGD
ncbi:MAG: energy-coupling factor ABC transporter substrate-binding protein [Candidatus Competibacteraceae bacterium]|nr:energy-coupling factor ABC transporter substrate-binding protein [Candidatus Competibacteraceae bacterium]